MKNISEPDSGQMHDSLINDIDVFLSDLREIRQASPHTVSNYQRDLLQCLSWLQQETDITGWHQLKRDHLRYYLVFRHQNGLSPRSLQRQLAAIRALLVYLQQEGRLTDNPADGLKAPKASQLLPKPVDPDQLQHTLNQLADESDEVELRDSAMLELFYACGLRLAELVALDLPQLNFAEQQVRVMGKGGKERLVPFGSKAGQALQKWLAVRQHWLKQPDEEAVFLGVRGKRINRSSVQQILARIGLEQGISDRLHPHRLRHSFASHLLESSGDLRGVQELLGHADISSTQIYTRLDYQHLARVYDDAHPRARRTPHRRK